MIKDKLHCNDNVYPTILWGVADTKFGFYSIIDWTVRNRKQSAIQSFDRGLGYTWKQWYRKGYRVVKLKATVTWMRT